MGGNEKLLDDIEAINKALYLDNKIGRRSLMSEASNRSLSVGKTHQKSKNKDSIEKESKKSIWSWKALKSLAVRNKKFNCCFSVQVHSIEGLPTLFDELCLVVHWKRRDGELTTRPVVVSQGIAVFEEQLTHTCSISGSKNGPNQSAKYEAKHFLLYASIYGTPELDLGKHRVDLTRLLPLALDELEENSSGKWTTSFRLSGNAKGGTLNVSFEYHIVGKTFTVFPSNTSLLEVKNLRRNSENAAKLLVQCEQSDELSTIRRAGSLPARSSASQCSAENIKDLHEVLPVPSSELSISVNVLYQKLEEEKVESSVHCKPQIDVCCEDVKTLKSDLALLSDPEKVNIETGGDLTEVSIREQGVEFASEVWEGKEEDTTKTGDALSEENAKPDSSLGMSHEDEPQLALLSKEVDTENEDISVSACNFKTGESAKESIMKELESALKRVSDLANDRLDSKEDENEVVNHDGGLDIKANFGKHRKGKSQSLDYDTESAASDFLDMLGIEDSPFSPSSESEPDSPRERLLRQFEKDTLADGGSLFNFDMDTDHQEFASDAPTGSDWRSIYEDLDYSSNVDSYVETPKIEIEPTSNKTRASMLEDLETEVLMHEWGLNERAFQYSPPKSSSGFGSPIDIPLEDPYQLPPLGEGLGSFIKTKNGGFLRSMNPSLFKNAKSGGSLIMQVSSPVVVPAEMGSGIMDILQHLASIGIEKLSIQANKLMPLEDITGQTMQHIGWETAISLDGTVRKDLLQHEFEIGQNMAGIQSKKGKPHRPKSNKLEANSDRDSEYVSLEDLAPLAMDKIEALSIEGLRIQSGMSDEDTPCNVSPQSIGEFSAIEGKKVNFGGAVGLEGTGALQLLDVKDNGGGDVDGLMGLSLTLEEWLRLDAGEIDDGDDISEWTSKLLAAHHASCSDLFRGRSKGEKRHGKGKNCRLLGNSFTVALMVQLRDPLRNYEPVGTPMLALVQVERVFVTPKPKMYSTVSQVRNDDDDDRDDDPIKESTAEVNEDDNTPGDEQIPQYKITEVHVAGLQTSQGKKKLWGSSSQQQSGSRWLLANGMGKKNKHPLMKSKAGNKSSTVQPGEMLWSISSQVHGTGAKWKELAALNPHIRNPNVIFPHEKIRLR
ncbi:hypothetical protein HAX54_028224 [Datura stramonium]|uniref:Protein PLASTID MOVEMENT IMPAIRED 1-RELATED 1-like n=1 Tax=Datura stramonium TaxID=4076 RepID=A0ABS8V3S3_DATST|nr:hypothetical protein [Datura stramonium]